MECVCVCGAWEEGLSKLFLSRQCIMHGCADSSVLILEAKY